MAIAACDAVLERHARRHRDRAVVALVQRLERVTQQVQEDLRESIGVADELWNRRVVDSLDSNALGQGVHAEQVQDVVEYAVDVDGLELQLVAAREDHQLIEQLADAVDLAHDERGRVARAFFLGPRLQQLGCAPDSAERVAHLVGDPRSDVAEPLELLSLRLPLAQRAAQGVVAQLDHQSLVVLAAEFDWRNGDIDDHVRLETALDCDAVCNRRPSLTTDLLFEIHDRVSRTEQVGELASHALLGRHLEDAARLGAEVCNPTGGVEQDDPVEQGVEHTEEIAVVHGGA